jgi:hypothetical protein
MTPAENDAALSCIVLQLDDACTRLCMQTVVAASAPAIKDASPRATAKELRCVKRGG